MNFSKNQNVYKWWVYSSISVVIFVQVGDQTGTNIAMPSMSAEFNADIPTVQWVYLLYTLCISSLLLPMGRFSDIFGRKSVYCSGLVVFVIGGIVATVSQNFPMLLIARAIQGIAVSMILANGMALLVEAFPKSERGTLGFVPWYEGPTGRPYFAKSFSCSTSVLINQSSSSGDCP